MTQSPDRPPQSYRTLLAGALLAVIVVAIGLLALREVVARPPPLEIILPTPTSSPSQLQVHIAGAVTSPGVYLLAPDTRLHEAIEAAGGATDEADLDAVNLALKVVDGQRYQIPRGGEEAAEVTDGLLDVNVASAAQLESLPGIGPVLAEAIVVHRRQNGPYQRLEDLLAVPGIGTVTLDRPRPLVTVS